MAQPNINLTTFAAGDYANACPSCSCGPYETVLVERATPDGLTILLHGGSRYNGRVLVQGRWGIWRDQDSGEEFDLYPCAEPIEVVLDRIGKALGGE